MNPSLTLLALAACQSQPPAPEPAAVAEAPQAATLGAATASPAAPESSVWPADLQALDGQPLPADVVAGKVVLVVNVASRCGYTPQYEGLQALHDRYAARGFTVLGVPCNQFGGQEPGNAEEIASFCKLNYGVSFPLLQKQAVNGPERSPLYQALIASTAGEGYEVGWNFEKFLVGRDGRVIRRFSSPITPADPTLVQELEKAL